MPPTLSTTQPIIWLQQGDQWLHFTGLRRVESAGRAEEIPALLRRVTQAVDEEQVYAVGYLRYEAAAAYGLAVKDEGVVDLPLAWFGLFTEVTHHAVLPEEASAAYQVGAWQPAVAADAYAAAVARIHASIAAGETYQVNYTFPLRASFQGDTWALFYQLAAAQRAGYMAYLDLGAHVIASASPELFFRLEGERITMRPMKGTSPRGRTLAEDEAQAAALRLSDKNQAENVMIVDMARNDLGRIAQVGSVAVPELFTVERYPTLWQMTSTVTARTSAPLDAIMAALFPCASITGAPKVRTMQIIQALEPTPRGIYTGAIGYLAPGRQAQFNVAIRTVVVSRPAGIAVYGVGSGLVWDSEPAAEYAECLLKAEVLHRTHTAFELLETLAWRPAEGYFLLERHLHRLVHSATYFQFAFQAAEARQQLTALAAGLTAPTRVRLLLGQDGRITLQTAPLPPPSVAPVRLGLALQPVASSDIWLYHKTTRRQVYQAALAARPECDEVLLWNERGEITEASRYNVAAQYNGVWITPPVGSGLLAGVLRQELLESGRLQERLLQREELAAAQGLAILNSVQGWRPAVFCP